MMSLGCIVSLLFDPQCLLAVSRIFVAIRRSRKGLFIPHVDVLTSTNPASAASSERVLRVKKRI